MRLCAGFLAFLAVLAGAERPSLPGITLGDSGNSAIQSAVVDSDGNIYVAGTTFSLDFPLYNASQTANSGTQVIYSQDAGATWLPLTNVFAAANPLQSIVPAVDPTNASTVYAGGGSNVCKSTDGGRHFACVSPFGASQTYQTSIDSIAVDPQQPLNVYASATVNGGVFKSADGGQTWTNASAGLPADGFLDSVVIDPFHPNALYAWAGIGGYVSNDGANSWALSTLPWPQGTSVSGGLHFSFDPVTPGIIYGPGFSQLTVQKSTDGGQTWTRLNLPFTSCCVVPDPQVSGVLYALAYPGGTPATPLLFWKSTDGGATWTSSAFPTSEQAPVAVDPADSQIILAGAYRSTDGGQTWLATNASRVVQPAFSPASSGLVYGTAAISSDAFVAKFLPDGRTLAFSTYFGGMGNDTGNAIALDAAGNIWIAGATSSYDLPVTAGAFQGSPTGFTNAFAAKFTNDGKLVAATYLGGSDNDSAAGIALSPQGNPWLIGNWNSPDFPFTVPLPAYCTSSACGFMAELDSAAGQLLYSAAVDGQAAGIAIDSSGNALITGTTFDAAFPVTAGAFQSGTAANNAAKAFVLKTDPAGNTIYSTFFGGSQVAPVGPAGCTGGLCEPETEHDYGIAVAVDGLGNVYVTGYTSATDFPTTAGAYQTVYHGNCPYPAFTDDTGFIGTLAQYYTDDVFVVKLSPDGKTPIYSTLAGGSCYDRVTSIAVDASGQAYVAGETDSQDFPLVLQFQGPPSYRQFASFVSGLDAGGDALTYSSYVRAGANPAVATGPNGKVYVAGATGVGAQTQPDTSAYSPFPPSATDGYLTPIPPPTFVPRRRP